MGFEQMLRRRHINADPRGRSARLLLAISDLVRWPFERLAWPLERRLVWPLRERLAGRGVSGRIVGATALAALAATAIAVGVLSSIGGDEAGTEVAVAPARVELAQPAPQAPADAPAGPVLQGAPPSFGVGKGVGVTAASEGGAQAPDQGAGTRAKGEAAEEAATPGETGAATSSSAKPVPAGPAAMKIARRFAEAFVFYEIGERPARAKAVFGETAEPQLAAALTERPPRLPEGTEVPKARVVNLVPGPRAGKAYTVSVSLLRLGLTSELRLEMRNESGSWLVTDVRG